MQATGDGTRRLLDLLDLARNRVEAAHRAWLAEMAAKANETDAAEATQAYLKVAANAGSGE